METQELKWLFQNCRASEVKSGTEFRILCSYLYQAVQEEGSSWVSKSCWATYSLGKKKVSSWVTSTGFCSTLLFIFDFSCRYQSDSHLPSWGLFAEVAKLQKKLLLSFTEASTILAIRKAHQIQITIESPNMYAVIPQINVYRGNVLSCCSSNPWSLSDCWRSSWAHGEESRWLQLSCKGSLHSQGREAGKSLPSQQLDAGEGGVRRGNNVDNYVNGNACHSFNV